MRPSFKKITITVGAVALAVGLAGYQIHRHGLAGKEFSKTKTAACDAQAQVADNAAEQKLTLEDWAQKIETAELKDFRSLISMAMRIGDPELRQLVVTGIVDKWLLEDAADFTKYWASLEVNGDAASLAALALALQESLTKLDPERAASDEILVVVQRLISYLAETDPDKALVWAKKWLLEDTLESALVSIARSMAKTDIKKALAVIDEMTSQLRRTQALASVGTVWASQDPKAAMKWALAISNPGDRALTLNSMLLAIAQLDPSGAAADLKAQAELITAEYQSSRAAEMASRGLKEEDLANDEVAYREMLEAGNITSAQSADAELMAPASRAIARMMALTDPAGALAWAESLPGDYLKLSTVSGALEGIVKNSPASAVDYIKENYPLNTDMIKSTYESWAIADPLNAAKGVNLIADPAQRALALETVVSTWAPRGNPVEVATYLDTLAPAEVSDGAKLALANAMSQASPQEAWNIAKGISNESTQYRALKTAFSSLVIQNPAQASALLASSNLSNNTSERLRNMLDAVVGN